MNQNNNSIVVYNSQYERDADIYWHEHPEQAAVFGCVIVAFVATVFFIALRKIFKK